MKHSTRVQVLRSVSSNTFHVKHSVHFAAPRPKVKRMFTRAAAPLQGSIRMFHVKHPASEALRLERST